MANENKGPKDYDRWGKTCIKITSKPKPKSKKVKKGK